MDVLERRDRCGCTFGSFLENGILRRLADESGLCLGKPKRTVGGSSYTESGSGDPPIDDAKNRHRHH